jgi:ABC-type uncharacterized transport system involved in gliding motility auxiliary subunit
MRRRLKVWSSNLTAYSLVLIGVIAVINYLSVRHYTRFDLTEAEQYTLSERTVEMLKNLDTGIRAIAFVKEGPEFRNRAERLLEQYRYHSRKFEFEFVDPDKNPRMAEKYGVKRYDTYIIVGGVEKTMGVERKEAVHPFLNEETLTNALIKVTSEREMVVYFTRGHGEKSIDDTNSRGYEQLREALKSENFRVSPLVLAGGAEVPADADVVVIAGPEKEFFDAELEILDNYLEEGGRLIFMIDPFTVEKTARFTEKYGVRLSDDIIVDKLSKMFGGDYLLPTVSNYDLDHEITEGFDVMTIFPVARSVEVFDGTAEGTKATRLAFTLPGTWGETDRKRLEGGAASMDRVKDNIGPLTVALAIEVELKSEREARADEEARIDVDAKEHEPMDEKGAMVVVGDSDFIANSYIGVAGNLDFFMNMVNWLAGETERIAIRPKDPEMVPIIFTDTQLALIAGFGIIGFPLAVLVPGIWINIARRRS